MREAAARRALLHCGEAFWREVARARHEIDNALAHELSVSALPAQGRERVERWKRIEKK